jgi:hypothetical protein
LQASGMMHLEKTLAPWPMHSAAARAAAA